MFIEERLDLGINYGTTATITTSTAIVETFSGIETRSINWVYPLLKFNIGQKSCLNEQLAYFLAFHAARKGAYEGFRFKDWSDYTFNTVITLNANKQAQLFKQYSVAGSSVKRPLSKIVTGTVLVFVNDVVTQGWTLNYNTGVITFNAIPTGTIRVSGEFDVPVRFESDKINLRFKAYEPGTERKLFDWEGLALTEVKISPAIPLAFDLIPQTLNHRINLGYDYDSIGGNEFATRIERLISGHETRISEWATNRGSWEVGSRTLLKSELDYLIALFRVCRGKAVSFKYFNWQSEEEIIVRFGEDAIAFRFDAYEKGTGRVLFNLAGVPLVNTITIISEDPPPPILLSNTGYGTQWNQAVTPPLSLIWKLDGLETSQWLTYSLPAFPVAIGEDFDWTVTYTQFFDRSVVLVARFLVDNYVMKVLVNGQQVLGTTIPTSFTEWNIITFPVPAGNVIISFIIRNITENQGVAFSPVNPTGFRLEWLSIL